MKAVLGAFLAAAALDGRRVHQRADGPPTTNVTATAGDVASRERPQGSGDLARTFQQDGNTLTGNSRSPSCGSTGGDHLGTVSGAEIL